MKMLIATIPVIAKKKTEFEFPTPAIEAEGPVLIFLREAIMIRPAFADDVKITITGHLRVHPSLQCQRVAVGEIKRTGFTRIGDSQITAV